MNAQVDTIPESFIDIKLAEAALAIAKDRLQWNTCKEFYGPIVNALQRIGADPYLSGGTIYVSMTGDKEKLTQAFRIFRSTGMDFTGSRPKKGDSSWDAAFRHPSQSVYVFFQFASSVCRRIKTGTKMVEQDVFEVQCGDISEPEAPQLTIVPVAEVAFDDEIPF